MLEALNSCPHNSSVIAAAGNTRSDTQAVVRSARVCPPASILPSPLPEWIAPPPAPPAVENPAAPSKQTSPAPHPGLLSFRRSFSLSRSWFLPCSLLGSLTHPSGYHDLIPVCRTFETLPVNGSLTGSESRFPARQVRSKVVTDRPGLALDKKKRRSCRQAGAENCRDERRRRPVEDEKFFRRFAVAAAKKIPGKSAADWTPPAVPRSIKCAGAIFTHTSKTSGAVPA